MPTVRADRATIHYMTIPSVPTCPTGLPAITFVHGGGGNAQAFLFQMPFFAACGYYCITVSVRGWGASRLDDDDAQHLLPDYLAGDITAVLDACGVQRTALLGHSIGGFLVTRMALEAPERLTHAIMSCTFYGIADAMITRYITDGSMGSIERHNVAAQIKAGLPVAVTGSRSSHGADAGRPFDRPDNFSDEFRASQPALAWLYDSFNEVNTQVSCLSLKSRFVLLQERGAVPPAELRTAFRGPMLFITTECDSAVHWECVEHVAIQCATHGAANTVVRCLDGRLRHAPNIEDPEQYNRVLLEFLRGAPSSPETM